MDAPAGPLQAGLSQLAAAGRLRVRREVESRGHGGMRLRVAGRDVLAFCSNDYLGLADHPSVVAAFVAAAREWGVGSGASHLVSGHCREHHALEEELAAFTRRPRALLFSTGYMANLAVVTTLLDYNVYRTGPKPAIDVARAIAGKMAQVRQPGVAFYGDRNRVVSSVGVGTGYFCDPIQFMGLAPDLFIAIDDVVRTWTQTVYAEDTGHPLVVVNHGATEEAGVRGLSEFLAKAYPERKVVHYPQGCGYEWVE